MTFCGRFSANGYYDDTGHWQRTKFCFVSCGARCTCGPPGGVYYNPLYDKSKEKEGDERDPESNGR